MTTAVTGTEDFRWEEPYVIGGWSQQEYERLKVTQPSYTDEYELLSIERGGRSKWMMFHEDIVARVRRKSDGKKFDLGLAELQVTDEKSPNFQLVDDDLEQEVTWTATSFESERDEPCG
jgi:hypothetical protein